MIIVQCEENDQIQMEISLNILDPSQAPRKRAAASSDLSVLKQKLAELFSLDEFHHF